MTSLPLLAQETNYPRLALALVGLIIVVGVLLALLAYYRRRMHVDQPIFRDFTLNDLRQLHRDGKLTDEELERAKARLVSSVQNKLAREARPTAPHAEPLNAELKSDQERS